MSEQTQPGWYPDPWGGAEPRWWDGVQWTAHVGASQPVAAPAAPSPASTAHIPVLTVWIWLVVLAPYVSILLLPFIQLPDLAEMMEVQTADEALAWQLSFFLNPAFIIMGVLGWAGTIVAIVAAYRDWKALAAAGLERPFHWAFVFLNLAVGPVYAIGRAVVVRQRTGRGLAVLWVTIGAFVLTLVITLVWTAVIMVDMFSQISELTGSSFG